MSRLPFAARVYVGSVIAAGGVVVLLCLPRARFDQPLLFSALMLFSFAAGALKVPLPLPTGHSTMSVSYAVNFATLLLLGPHETMIVVATSAFSQCHLNRKNTQPLYRTLFSMAVLIITVQGAGLAFEAFGGRVGGGMGIMVLIRPLVVSATVYFLLNTAMVAWAIALTTHQRVEAVWQANFLWSAPGYFIDAGVAGLAASIITHAGYWLTPLVAAPLYLTYRTYKVSMGHIEDKQRHVKQTSDLHLATIEALARAIDAKDQTAQTHIRRVQFYAAGLARVMGLSEPEIQGIETAALLHDIGKLAVPEHILSKPGPLTQEEFQKIRIHPQVGAEIIAAVPFPYPVAPLILSHHERWDGSGYPHGLKGEQIPLGARILSAVDYYDAVTSERPYHKALNHDSAVALMKHEAGKALDPAVVAQLTELFPTLIEQERKLKPEDGIERAATERTTEDVQPERARKTAFENIALAHREIYALYEIAQSMGTSLGVPDTMSLISAKLTNIIPWSGCALFLYQPETESLRCRFAAGVDAPKLLDQVIPSSEALAGWVARNRRTIVNGDPRVTFDAAGIGSSIDLRTAIVCPLFHNDTVIGSLALYHVDANRYVEDDRRLLERIAEQAGSVIHNSIVFEQTQEDSLTDPLTGLPNRRSMFAHLRRELARAERMRGELAMIVMDLDHFKSINDTYGHHVGDRALREMASALRATLRPYDLCVRYAGDEFIIVLGDCGREAAETKRRELQQRVSSIELEVRPGKLHKLAASAGLAVFPQDGKNYEELLASADHAMYRDKTARRARRKPSRAPETSEPPIEPFDDEPLKKAPVSLGPTAA